MKKLQIILIVATFIIFAVLLALIVYGFIQLYNETQEYKEQCIAWGYNTFQSEGWTGDFCVGEAASLQVIAHNGKLSKVEK